MRRDGQELEAEEQRQLPGYREPSVVRRFQAPEALDIRFMEVRAKSVLNRVPEIFFDWLRAHRPELVSRYEELYRSGAYASESARRQIQRAAGLPGLGPVAASGRYRDTLGFEVARMSDTTGCAESRSAPPTSPARRFPGFPFVI